MKPTLEKRLREELRPGETLAWSGAPKPSAVAAQGILPGLIGLAWVGAGAGLYDVYLTHAGSFVLEAPPGAGKTTRVPIAMLDAGLVEGEILVLQPRRLAARLAASRVAEERGEKPGETVGWQVRFEDVSGPRTRLKFLTEGVLTRRLLSDPSLRGVGAVVLDEFHERHLDGDLAAALLKRLQKT